MLLDHDLMLGRDVLRELEKALRDKVKLPNVDIGRNTLLRRVVVDKHCRLPEGLEVGVDPDVDRRRFRVTERGITVIVPEMLGQQVHHLR